MPLVLKSYPPPAEKVHEKVPQNGPATASKTHNKGPPRTTALTNLPQVMTEAEVAAYVGLTLKQVTRMRYEKQGPKTFKLGTQRRVLREDLIGWVTAQASK